jgi:hypothetical protein
LKVGFNVSFAIIALPIGLQLRKIFLIEKNEPKRSEIIDKISDDMFKRIWAKTRQFTHESNGKEMVEFQYGFFRFVLQKSAK